MTGPIQHSHFSTGRLTPDQRIDAWRDSIGAVFDVTPDTLHATAPFDASVSSYLINNQLMLSRCDTRAQRFTRNPLRVAKDNLDYYLIQTHLTGSQVMRLGTREVTCRPGELMVIDLAEQHDSITTDFSQLTLVVPRQLLSVHLTQPDSQEGRVLKADAGLTHLAVHHLTSLYASLGQLSANEALELAQPTLLLMAAALNGRADTVEQGPEAVNASLRATARTKIERHLHEQLSVDRLCSILGYSRSTLYRLFEPLGGVRAYVQDRRLRRSASVLMADHSHRLRICDVAYRCGFASEAHFSRAFRERYGMSPSEARRQLRVLRDQSPAGYDRHVLGDRDYEIWLGDHLRRC